MMSSDQALAGANARSGSGELCSRDERNLDMQDAELLEKMSRRRSSFTALVGQASGLRDLLRRCEAISAPFAD